MIRKATKIQPTNKPSSIKFRSQSLSAVSSRWPVEKAAAPVVAMPIPTPPIDASNIDVRQDHVGNPLGGRRWKTYQRYRFDCSYALYASGRRVENRAVTARTPAKGTMIARNRLLILARVRKNEVRGHEARPLPPETIWHVSQRRSSWRTWQQHRQSIRSVVSLTTFRQRRLQRAGSR